MAEENEYERQRAQTIARNRRMMEEMGIGESKRALAATVTAECGQAAKTPRTTKPRERKPRDTGPARRSGRNEGRPTPNYAGMEPLGEARPFRASRTPRRRGEGPSRLPGGGYALPRDPREWHESRGEASAEAAEAALDAALAFISEALDEDPARADDFHWKILTASQCRGGYWSTAPETLRDRMRIVQRALRFTLGEVTSPASLPYTAAVGGGWPVVWLPHGGETRAGGKGHRKTPSEKAGAKSAGFSGGWKGFARDLMLYPRDVCVFEVEPVEAAGALPDALKVHVFRAFDYEEDGEAIVAAAQGAWDAAEEALGLEKARKAAREAAREEEEGSGGDTPLLLEPTERLNLSGEGGEAGEGDQEAQSPVRPGDRRRHRATLTAAAPAAVAAAVEEAEAEEEAEEPAPKRRKRQPAPPQRKAAPPRRKAAAKKAAPPSETEAEEESSEDEPTEASDPSEASEEGEEGERFVVERIEGVQIDEDTGERLYWIKWEGYDCSENSWEPAGNLDAALENYRRAPGVRL